MATPASSSPARAETRAEKFARAGVERALGGEAYDPDVFPGGVTLWRRLAGIGFVLFVFAYFVALTSALGAAGVVIWFVCSARTRAFLRVLLMRSSFLVITRGMETFLGVQHHVWVAEGTEKAAPSSAPASASACVSTTASSSSSPSLAAAPVVAPSLPVASSAPAATAAAPVLREQTMRRRKGAETGLGGPASGATHGETAGQSSPSAAARSSPSSPSSSLELLARFRRDEASGLVVVNHRTRLDWMLLAGMVERFGSLARLRIALAEGFASVPGVGWAVQMGMYLMLRRNWAHDERHMRRYLTFLAQPATTFPVQLVVFPEGTDLQRHSVGRSHAWSDKMGRPRTHFVLHPRTTGFVLAQRMLRRHTEGCWVLTVGYPAYIGQDELDILRGTPPPSSDYYFEFFPWKDVPADDAGAAAWLEERFDEMEVRLRSFYTAASADPQRRGAFPGAQRVTNPPLPWHDTAVVVLPLAALVSIAYYWAVWNFAWFRLAFAWGIAFCLIGTHAVGGIDKLDLSLSGIT